MVTTDKVGDHDDDDDRVNGGGGGGECKVSRSCRSGSHSGQTGLQLASIVSTTTAAKVGESLSFLVLSALSSSAQQKQQLLRFQVACCFGYADAGQAEQGSFGSGSVDGVAKVDGPGVGNRVLRLGSRMMKREEEENVCRYRFCTPRKIVCHYRRISSNSSSRIGSTGVDVGNIYEWCRKLAARSRSGLCGCWNELVTLGQRRVGMWTSCTNSLTATTQLV